MSGTISAPANAPSKPHLQHPQREQHDPASLTLLQSLQATITGTSTGTGARTGTRPSTNETTSATEIYSTQIAHRSLILRATSPDTNSQDARAIRRKKRLAAQTRLAARQRPRKLSAKEKRRLGVYDIELVPGARRTAASWTVWKGLWRLWCGYVWEVLGLGLDQPKGENRGTGRDGMVDPKKMKTKMAAPRGLPGTNLSPMSVGPKLASLDLHGALLRVVKAECTSVVGLWGVCVRETKFGVLLVDDKCCVRRIGKKGAVFRVEIPLPLDERRGADADMLVDGQTDAKMEDAQETGLDLDVFLQGEGGRVLFEMSGSALLCRPADRATKKFKGRKYDGF